jgi:uncharacterized protein (TIGR02145 family)
MTGLTPQATYYARAYVINKAGTAYGEELTFTTPADHSGETGTVADIDGNVYQTIGIGSQYWTTGNLKTTQFNDGTPIPFADDNLAWESLAGPGYCYYYGDPLYLEVFGALYNWYAVVSSKLPPAGWHVPTDANGSSLKPILVGYPLQEVSSRKPEQNTGWLQILKQQMKPDLALGLAESAQKTEHLIR